MRRTYLGIALVTLGMALAPDAPADYTPPTPVTVTVVGKGTIRLLVADGSSRPCDASDNHVLFSGHATAGEALRLAAASGSVCVDHTYGSMRESQWSGASIWSGSSAGWTGVRSLAGAVSTDEP
jgi:hypothetical protein